MARVNDLTPIKGRPSGVGTALLSARCGRGMTQGELAEAAGLALKTVQRAERGAPSVDTLWRLGIALDLPFDALTPGWTLPSCPHAAGPGAKFRERRRWRRLTLATMGRDLEISPAELSRFERGLGVPRKWTGGHVCDPNDYVEIRDRLVAWALDFPNVEQLNDYLNSPDCRGWVAVQDRRSLLRRSPRATS